MNCSPKLLGCWAGCACRHKSHTKKCTETPSETVSSASGHIRRGIIIAGPIIVQGKVTHYSIPRHLLECSSFVCGLWPVACLTTCTMLLVPSFHTTSQLSLFAERTFLLPSHLKQPGPGTSCVSHELRSQCRIHPRSRH